MAIGWMNDVWKRSPYDGARLLIHLAMADHSDDEGRFFSAQTSLAEKARCSVEYVRQTVNLMVEERMLVVERKGTARGRSTEYRLLPLPNRVGLLPLPNSDGQLPNSDGQLPNSDGQLPNSARGQSSVQPPDQSEQAAPPAQADAETLNQRVNRLTRTYCDVVKLSKFPAIMVIVRKAIAAGYADDAITAALSRLAVEGRPVTVDVLRIELEGLPAARQQPRAGTRTDRAMDNYRQFEQQAISG